MREGCHFLGFQKDLSPCSLTFLVVFLKDMCSKDGGGQRGGETEAEKGCVIGQRPQGVSDGSWTPALQGTSLGLRQRKLTGLSDTEPLTAQTGQRKGVALPGLRGMRLVFALKAWCLQACSVPGKLTRGSP